MYKTYTKQTYENSLKSKREMIISSSFIIDGYCEMQNGILHFRGDIPGVSYSQARYYLIYMIRDIYGPEVWINPIFFSISKSAKNNYKDRAMYFNLKPYQDNSKRIFIKFSSYEKSKQTKDKSEIGDLMPKSYKVDTLPEMNNMSQKLNVSDKLFDDFYFEEPSEPYVSNVFLEPSSWDTLEQNNTTINNSNTDGELVFDLEEIEFYNNFNPIKRHSYINNDWEDNYVSIAELEESCCLPEGYHLFDDDR